MDKNLLCHIKIFIPAYNELPIKKAQEWAKKYYQGVRHISGHRRNAIRTQKDFREKMAKPIIQTTRRFINPEFISRSGLTAENIISKSKDKLLDGRTADKYLKRLDLVYRKVDGVTAKNIRDKLPLGAADYALKMTFGAYRLIGPVQETGKSPLSITESWLGGDVNAINFLRKKDELISGKPMLIVTPKRLNEFRNRLRGCLMRAGSDIYIAHYSPEVIKEQNDKINNLINGFITEQFMPFSADGESHLNFVLIPESVIPSDSPLINDIKYKVYAFFLGEEKAGQSRSKWCETRRVAPVDPKYYIGNPEKSAYFDMYLDTRITAR